MKGVILLGGITRPYLKAMKKTISSHSCTKKKKKRETFPEGRKGFLEHT